MWWHDYFGMCYKISDDGGCLILGGVCCLSQHGRYTDQMYVLYYSLVKKKYRSHKFKFFEPLDVPELRTLQGKKMGLWHHESNTKVYNFQNNKTSESIVNKQTKLFVNIVTHSSNINIQI